MNGNVRKDGKIWNTGVALLKYFAGLNSNQNGQYGQIYAEKFTSACCKEVNADGKSACSCDNADGIRFEL